jgi:tRNA-dihydrouridine synthase
MNIPVIGNGDVINPEIALTMKQTYGVDAIMIGRASIGNPWIFRDIKDYLKSNTLPVSPSLKERTEICMAHLRKNLAIMPERTALLEFRKHYSGYFKGIPNFKPVRIKLLTSVNFSEIESILVEFLIPELTE